MSEVEDEDWPRPEKGEGEVRGADVEELKSSLLLFLSLLGDEDPPPKRPPNILGDG